MLFRSCSFTRLRSMVISSDRLIALAGVWEPSPISSLPALTAFSHVWMVPSGIPNSENVEFILQCDGKRIAYDNGKGIRKTREEKIMKECIAIHPGNRVAVDIPKTVSWSAAHPFQGGRVSPR